MNGAEAGLADAKLVFERLAEDFTEHCLVSPVVPAVKLLAALAESSAFGNSKE